MNEQAIYEKLEKYNTDKEKLTHRLHRFSQLSEDQKSVLAAQFQKPFTDIVLETADALEKVEKNIVFYSSDKSGAEVEEFEELAYSPQISMNYSKVSDFVEYLRHNRKENYERLLSSDGHSEELEEEYDTFQDTHMDYMDYVTRNPEDSKVWVMDLPGPISEKYSRGREAVRVLQGPVGAGKSETTFKTILGMTASRPKDRNGVREANCVIVRALYTELGNTVVESVDNLIPSFPDISKNIRKGSPITVQIKVKNSFELNLVCYGLQRYEDTNKLNSTNFTYAFINEGQTIDQSIPPKVIERTLRYPPMSNKPTTVSDKEWLQTNCSFIDANAGFLDGWLRRYREDSIWAVDPVTRERVNPEDIPLEMRWGFYMLPGGRSPDAENVIGNHGRKVGIPLIYYDRIIANNQYNPNVIKRLVDNIETPRDDGLSVYYSVWNPEEHIIASETVDPYRVVRDTDYLFIGIDVGLNPGVVFMTQQRTGELVVMHEITSPELQISHEDLLDRVVDYLTELKLTKDNPNIYVFMDPVSWSKSHLTADTAASRTKAKGFKHVYPGGPKANRQEERINNVREMLQSVQGRQRKIKVLSSCEILINGFNGGYIYKKKRGTTDNDFFAKEIQKGDNPYTHVHDALQYAVSGYKLWRKGHAANPLQIVQKGILDQNRKARSAGVINWI